MEIRGLQWNFRGLQKNKGASKKNLGVSEGVSMREVLQYSTPMLMTFYQTRIAIGLKLYIDIYTWRGIRVQGYIDKYL